MLFDSLSRLALESHVVAATAGIGFPVAMIRPIGWILLVCTILYTIPRTAVLGAILLTGFMGGAVASKIRIEDPLLSSILFGVYFGIILWAISASGLLKSYHVLIRNDNIISARPVQHLIVSLMIRLLQF